MLWRSKPFGLRRVLALIRGLPPGSALARSMAESAEEPAPAPPPVDPDRNLAFAEKFGTRGGE